MSAQRQAERDGFYAVMEAFRNSTPGLAGRALPGPHDYAQIPALAERGRRRIAWFHDFLDRRLGDSAYVGGPAYSVADITALISVDFALRQKVSIPETHANLKRWHEQVSARPSSKL